MLASLGDSYLLKNCWLEGWPPERMEFSFSLSPFETQPQLKRGFKLLLNVCDECTLKCQYSVTVGETFEIQYQTTYSHNFPIELTIQKNFDFVNELTFSTSGAWMFDLGSS